jgi:hypothetical protein
MTRNEAIQASCEIMGLAFHSIFDAKLPGENPVCDCFCFDSPHYQNNGEILDYVRRAVLEKLDRDCIAISQIYNEEGKLRG